MKFRERFRLGAAVLALVVAGFFGAALWSLGRELLGTYYQAKMDTQRINVIDRFLGEQVRNGHLSAPDQVVGQPPPPADAKKADLKKN